MNRFLLLVILLVTIPAAISFWWIATEEEKNICLERSSKYKNEFSAKLAYNKCLKEIKKQRKYQNKKSNNKSPKEICDERKASEISKLDDFKIDETNPMPQVTKEGKLYHIELMYGFCIREAIRKNAN